MAGQREAKSWKNLRHWLGSECAWWQLPHHHLRGAGQHPSNHTGAMGRKIFTVHGGPKYTTVPTYGWATQGLHHSGDARRLVPGRQAFTLRRHRIWRYQRPPNATFSFSVGSTTQDAGGFERYVQHTWYCSSGWGTRGALERASVFQDAVERRDIVHHCPVRHGR